MKFYKCHSTKYKNDKVFYMGDQFTEIGPDAFLQTEFEVIFVSNYVTVIRDHAFSKVENCSIYIPSSVEEIEVSAFDDMGNGNIIYCDLNSIVHKTCIERGIVFDNDVAACIKLAKKIKEEDEAGKRLAETLEIVQKQAEKIRKDAEDEARRIIEAAHKEAETVKETACKEAEMIKEAACKEAEQIKNTAHKQAEQIVKEANEKARITEEKMNSKPGTDAIKNADQPRVSSSVQQKPVQKSTTNSGGANRQVSIFSDIDKYDDELKKMHPQQPSGPVFKSNHSEQHKLSSIGAISNLDEYDDELKKMNQNQQKKNGWDVFR